MTLNEFKAWFEGYSESFTDGVPNKEQMDKVKEKLDCVQAETFSYPVYHPAPYQPDPYRWIGNGTGAPQPQWPQTTCMAN